LFQDLYEWAGLPRSYDVKKGEDIFVRACELPKYENEVFIRSINFSNLPQSPQIDDAAKSLASCLGIINIFHPFPEGNGRAQRLFISALASVFKYSLDWNGAQAWEIVETSKAVHRRNYKPLERLVEKIIRDDSKV
jgi:cell filamentation protein